MKHLFLILTLLCILGAIFMLVLGLPVAWGMRARPLDRLSGQAVWGYTPVQVALTLEAVFALGAFGFYRAHVRVRDKQP